MIPRHAEPRLKRLARQFPAVLLLGARQCGKTTLVRHFVDGRYFDLERPSDLQVFAEVHVVPAKDLLTMAAAKW